MPIKTIDDTTFDEQNRHHFRQQSRSNSRSTDTKGFHRNGDDSPNEKRYGSSDGMIHTLSPNFFRGGLGPK